MCAEVWLLNLWMRAHGTVRKSTECTVQLAEESFAAVSCGFLLYSKVYCGTGLSCC